MTSGFVSTSDDPHFLVQRARVIEVEEGNLQPDPVVEGLYLGQQVAEVEILGGEFAGHRVRFVNTLSRFFNHNLTEGMEILVSVNTHPDTGQIVFVDVFSHSRSTFLYIFIAFFLLVLLVIGRRKGLYSALSLAFTLVMVIFFLIPRIIAGDSPVPFAVITAAFTTVFTILMVGDVSLKSIAAIGGTMVGVTCAGVISVIAGRLAHVSGMQMENAEAILIYADNPIRVPDLLFAGIIIAALGAVMDVAMSISSSVFEIKQASPKMDGKKLYKSGMRIGGDIMGTMSNTLILAFAGTSMIIMVIIALYQLPYMRFINLNLLAIEIIQGLSASIGLILTVPVTALLAALLASNNKVSKFLKTKAKVVEQEQKEG